MQIRVTSTLLHTHHTYLFYFYFSRSSKASPYFLLWYWDVLVAIIDRNAKQITWIHYGNFLGKHYLTTWMSSNANSLVHSPYGVKKCEFCRLLILESSRRSGNTGRSYRQCRRKSNFLFFLYLISFSISFSLINHVQSGKFSWNYIFFFIIYRTPSLIFQGIILNNPFYKRIIFDFSVSFFSIKTKQPQVKRLEVILIWKQLDIVRQSYNFENSVIINRKVLKLKSNSM